MLICQECALTYQEKDTATEEQINTMFGPGSNQSRIITAKKRKKYYDSFANLIPEDDKDIMQDRKIIFYNEQKQGEERVSVKRK